MTVTHQYLDDVLHREPMFPAGFEPDWLDHPWQHKVYPGAPRLALPDPEPRLGPLSGPPRRWDVRSLSTMLAYSYGLLSRRLRVTANPEQHGQIPYSSAVWARGSAAGGGLYPCEIYWLHGSSDGALPGIYHYSPPQHAMNRIALGDPTEGAGDSLLVTVKFWQNAFKYADFCYHCVCMDVGCLLATWQAISAAQGVALRPRFWFDEAALDEVLGLDPTAESVFAVVALPMAPPTTPHAAPPTVRVSEVERSRNVRRWPRVQSLHQAAMVEERQPGPGALDAAAVRTGPERGAISLPADESTQRDLGAVLRNRKSSFGRFSAHPPLSAMDFGTLLAATDSDQPPHPELRSLGLRTTRVVTVAQHVASVPPGVYDYLPDEPALRKIREPDAAWQLQQHYALSNYNLEQAAALVAIVARPHRFLDACGARAYRLLGAEVGAVAQHLYLAASALGVGCGAVLGFDNAAMAPHLGLAETDEWPMLLLMLGYERSGEADLDTSLLPWVSDVG